MENWKQINGYEGLYEISNLGRVKSNEKKVYYNHAVTKKRYWKISKEKIMSMKDTRGYNFITLSKENVKKNLRICRLVAIHFIDNPNNKQQVNHIDCNKKNDNLNNLEWVTPSENMQHAKKNGLLKFNGTKNCKKVICTNTGKVYKSITEFANEKKIDTSNITRALNGTYKNNHNVAYFKD